MKLELVLNYLNSFEKNAFLKIVDSIISERPANYKRIESILNQLDGQLKNADNLSIVRVLGLVENEFSSFVKKELLNSTSQLDILIDIIIRDGNSLMKREWLGKLYEKEIKKIKTKLKDFEQLLEKDSEDIRIRDYKIYRDCLKTAYKNDIDNNLEEKITNDELSILVTLSNSLNLSHEEVKLINYQIIPLKKLELDEMIKYLNSIGVIFYSRKNYQLYVADEVINILRKIRGKEISDKVFRRALKLLKDSYINQLSRRHNIDRKLSRELKIKQIINEGISFKTAFSNGIFKEDVNKSERKAFLTEFIEKRLKVDEKIKGATLDAKLDSLVKYFETKEKDGAISISMSGYDKLLKDLNLKVPNIKDLIREEFELQEEDILKAKFLLNFNIKPIDVLYVLGEDILKTFAKEYSISTRGNEVQNILNAYKDVENLYVENYVNIARRDYNQLIDNGLELKEADLGIKFEEVTKTILKKLGFNVDDTLRTSLNNSKNKIDIILKEGEKEIVIIECKSAKERGYNKYSSVSRQVRSYKSLAEKNGYTIKKIFIIAPEFTDDFVNECGLDYELNVSLINANTLYEIYEVFIDKKLKSLPLTLLMRDVLINQERVIKAITK